MSSFGCLFCLFNSSFRFQRCDCHPVPSSILCPFSPVSRSWWLERTRDVPKTLSLARSPSHCLSHQEEMPDSIPNLFNFSVQTRSLCTLAVRNLAAYSSDTHRVERNGMLGRGEDTHERAAHISLELFSLRPASWLGGPSPAHQGARVVRIQNWPGISLPFSDASPGIKKSSSHFEKTRHLEIDSGMRGRIGQEARAHKSFSIFQSRLLS